MSCEGDDCNKDEHKNKEREEDKKQWWLLLIGGGFVLVLLLVIVYVLWTPQPSPDDLASIRSWLQRVPNLDSEVIRNTLVDRKGFSKDLIECIMKKRYNCPQLHP